MRRDVLSPQIEKLFEIPELETRDHLALYMFRCLFCPGPHIGAGRSQSFSSAIVIKVIEGGQESCILQVLQLGMRSRSKPE